MRIRYNAPIVLTFSLLAILILILNATITPRLVARYFSLGGTMNWGSVADWFRLFSYPLGHTNWVQLAGNLVFVLLLGPMLEAIYGGRLLLLMVVTAVVAGLVNVLLFSSPILGASGIVFMLLALSALNDLRAGSLPLTFLLLVVVFISGELLHATRGLAQVAHLIGGGVGAAMGLLLRR